MTMWYFSFSFLINLQKFLHFCFILSRWGAEWTLMRNKINFLNFIYIYIYYSILIIYIYIYIYIYGTTESHLGGILCVCVCVCEKSLFFFCRQISNGIWWALEKTQNKPVTSYVQIQTEPFSLLPLFSLLSSLLSALRDTWWNPPPPFFPLPLCSQHVDISITEKNNIYIFFLICCFP